jgi:hypothetical protein
MTEVLTGCLGGGKINPELGGEHGPVSVALLQTLGHE